MRHVRNYLFTSRFLHVCEIRRETSSRTDRHLVRGEHYASHRLRRDREVCLAAARNNADALYYSKVGHSSTVSACMAVRANPDA